MYHMAAAAAAAVEAVPVPQWWLAAGCRPWGAAVGAVAVGAAVAWAWFAVEGVAAPSSHRKAGGTAEGTAAGHTQANRHHLAVGHHSRTLVEAHHSPYRSRHHW